MIRCATYRTRYRAAFASLLGVLCVCLGLGSAWGQEEAFPFIREFKELSGTKAPATIQIEKGDEEINQIIISPDSKQLFIRCRDKLTIWDIRTRKQTATWKFETWFGSMALMPEGQGLIFVGRDHKDAEEIVTLYDPATQKKVRTWPVPDRGRPTHVVCGGGGRFAVQVQPDKTQKTGTIHVWSVSEKGDKPQKSFAGVGERGEVALQHGPLVAFLPNQKLLVSACADYDTATVFRFEDGKTEPLLDFGKRKAMGGQVASSRDGSVWTMGRGIWNRMATPSGGEVAAYLPFEVQESGTFAFCPKGRYVVTTNSYQDFNELLVWDIIRDDESLRFKKRANIRRLPEGMYQPQIAVSPDGAHLVVAGRKQVLIWDARALLPVTDPVLLNQDLMAEIHELREHISSLERRLKELEPKK